MDGLTGVYSKLQNAQVPLNDRIELCRHVLDSSDLFLPNKNQVLADWLCNELNHLRILQGKKDGEELLEVRKNQSGIWKLLHKILGSPQGEHVALRQRFLSILFRELTTLKEYFESGGPSNLEKTTISCAVSVFVCCNDFLQNPQMSLVLFNKLDNMDQCVKEVLSCFLAVLYRQSLESTALMDELSKLVTVVLRQCGAVHCQQVTQRKVFGNLCEKLLHLLLTVKYAVCSENTILDKWNLQESIRADISLMISSVITTGLFHKDHLVSYKTCSDGMNLEEPATKKPKISSYTEQLFEVLRSSVDEQVWSKFATDEVVSLLWRKSVSTSFPFILESFLKAAKDEVKRSAKFNFFVKLYNITSSQETECGKAIPEVDRMTVLNQMLQILLDYNVYQIAEDNVDNQPMFKWFVTLTEHILQSHKNNNAILFRCLNTLLNLNHKILENVLQSLIERCLVKPCECSEEVEEEKADLFCNLIETYHKLQQVEHLVKCMLSVIKSLAGNIGSFPVGVLTKLSQAFKQCPLNLTLSLYKVFLDETKSLFECLQSSQEKLTSGDAMEVIATLFVTFLTNSSYNASDQHGLNIKKASSLKELLEDTNDHLLKPLIKAFPLCKNSCQKGVGFSTLYLLYGFNIVTGYLRRHDIIADLDNNVPQISWNSILGTFSPDQSWDSVEIVTKNDHIRFCTEMLVAQKARCLLASEKPNLEEINCCVNFLYDLDNFSAIPKASSHSWNGDPCSVTSKNYAVAHWSLIAMHAPLLISHCDERQVRGFAKCFLRTLVQHDQESLREHFTTVKQISGKLLEGAELHALSSPQTAIVNEFWELVGRSADKVAEGRFPRLANVFSWNSVEENQSESQEDIEQEVHSGNCVISKLDSDNEEMESQESIKDEVTVEISNGNAQKSMTAMHHAISVAQDLAELMKEEANKMRKSLKKENKLPVKNSQDLQAIGNLLNVLQYLPCSSFTPINQARCLLGLLACDVLVGTCTTGDMGITLQVSCRHTLVSLLQECLQHRGFAACRVVDMEAFLAWLFATIMHQDLSFNRPMSKDQSNLAEVSNDLLRVAVTLAVKSHRKTSLSAIRNFSDELLASIGVSVKIELKEGKILELIYTVVSACAELLEQKLLSKASATVVSGVVMGTTVSLIDLITLFLKDGGKEVVDGVSCERNTSLETLVLKLSGVITKSIGVTARPGVSTNSEEERLGEWGEVVTMVLAQTMEKLENEMKSLPAPIARERVVAYVTVLEDITQCRQEDRELLPGDFQAKIFRLGLEILSACGLHYQEIDKSQADGDKPRELGDVVLGLFSTILEVNDGENCVALLEDLVDLSVDNDGEIPPLKLLTGLSVLKMLLTRKVVKKRKKDLRAKFGKVLVILLSRATTNVEALTLVLEIVASVLSLGNGSLFPQDLALVFQALALARDIKMTEARPFSRLFSARFKILSWTLFYYHDYVYGVIHLFLTCTSDLLSSLLTGGSKDVSLVLPSCAQKMSRLYQELSSHKDVFCKYSTYFLADCIHLLSTQGIPGLIRETLIEGVHCILDICKDDTLTKVHVYLPSNERELFRSLKEDFTKHHKFKGNA